MSKPQEFMVPLYRLELVRERNITYQSVDRVEAAAEVFHAMLDSAPVEKLAVIHCNLGMQMIGAEIVAIGSMEMVGAAMADLFKGAIRNNAARIWMAHNHVDGNVKASIPDFGYTLRAAEASVLLGIGLYDHLVIAPGAYYSVFEHKEDYHNAVVQLEREALLRTLKDQFGASLPSKF